MIHQTILDAIGHTPIIRLQHLPDPQGAQVLVKFEGLNVGGSIKTRTALQMIENAERDGKIGPDTVIVEPTSGNQGIGLALIGAVKGYRTIIIMPDSVSEERRKLVRHYGAEVILVHDAGNIGACIEECLETALRMQREDPNVFVPQQFSNPGNLEAHHYHTAVEILEQVAGPRLLLRRRHGRHDQRHRRGAALAESWHGHLGGGAGERGDSLGRKRRDASADGHRRRRHPGQSESGNLR